jgi:thiol-disulfide isomerase/thioredoxin
VSPRARGGLALRLVLGAALCCAIAHAAPTLEKAPAPEFRAHDLDGHEVSLAALRAQGPVVVDFWATWCEPCREALLELEGWRKLYGPRGLAIVAVSVDGPRNIAKVRPYVSRLKLGFPAVIDDDQQIQKLYQVTQMPTAFLVDRDGKVVATRVGYRRGETTFVARIEALLPADSTAGDSAR